MFRSINSKFYVIVMFAVIAFCVGYALLAYFLKLQSGNLTRARDIAIVEKDFTKLNEMFHGARFWEKVIFSKNDPEAEMQYGALIEKIRVLSTRLGKKELSESTKLNFKQIDQQINQYEEKFNQLIQLRNRQSLTATRIETNYRSMTSTVLISNNFFLLKPMFNLTHFLITYNHGRTSSKYQALTMVIDGFGKKVHLMKTPDVRINGYLNSFKELLSEDYARELELIAINEEVEIVTSQIQKHFTDIASELEIRLKSRIQETTKIREKLKRNFLIAGISGIFIFLFIIYLFLRNIITPVKSMAVVMKNVKAGDIDARFINLTGNKDDIVQLGLSFNDMLDTMEDNNQKLLDYQKELENKIEEISRQRVESQELTEKLHQSQKMESIGALAAGIDHDFNNILSAIIGFTQLSLDEVEEGTFIEDNLQEVYIAGLRAKDLVKQILAFARQSDEEMKPIQVDAIVGEVIKFIRSSIPTFIEIRQRIDTNSVIIGNPTQVHQIFMNLCTNAAHAMEENGGILEISMEDVLVDNNTHGGTLDLAQGLYIEIKISDTGAGIAPDVVDFIFEPYFTTKAQGEGTGMGLAMVHGIVEEYGGKITVNTQLDKGTVFTIYLPISMQRKGRCSSASEELPTGTENILFVDDEVPIAKMGKQMLEKLGYSVTSITSSFEALELFRFKSDEFDMVITDMAMPKMSGEVLAVKLMKIRPDIPVILCTGYSSKISSETAKKIGIKAFAYKPIIKLDLARSIRKVLDEVSWAEE